MGEAIAVALAKAGARVTAIDMKPCPATLQSQPALVDYAQGDLRDQAFVEATIAGAHGRAGRLDYLANVAGVLWFGRDKSLLDMDLSVWDDVMDINLKRSADQPGGDAVDEQERRRRHGPCFDHPVDRGDQPQDAYQASRPRYAQCPVRCAHGLLTVVTIQQNICPGQRPAPPRTVGYRGLPARSPRPGALGGSGG
ncbi:MAG: SDR family NAD(P)-dependent oxidoreductase [Hyphomicrobiales bacterium]